MTFIQTVSPNYIAFCTYKQEALSAKIEALDPVFEKSATELMLKAKLLRFKNIVNI